MAFVNNLIISVTLILLWLSLKVRVVVLTRPTLLIVKLGLPLAVTLALAFVTK